MKKGLIALIVTLLIGVLAIFIYQGSLQPKYPGKWELIDGTEECFDEIEFSPGPRDYKGTVLRKTEAAGETVYLAGHYHEQGDIVVEIFNYEDIPLLYMQHEKKGKDLHLTYEWQNETNSCTYHKND